MADGISQAEGYCLACWQMGMPEEALSLCKERLERSPSSVDYLRLKYLSLRQCGDAEGAGRALSTLLELDPDDGGGIWYRRHPEDTRMYAGQLMLLPALAAQVSLVPRRLQRAYAGADASGFPDPGTDFSGHTDPVAADDEGPESRLR